MTNIKFNDLVIKEIEPLLSEYGFKIPYLSENIVNFESITNIIHLVHNPRENSNIFLLGSVSSNEFIEIDNQVIKEFLNHDIEINNLPIKKFIDNFLLLFKEVKNKLLANNDSFFLELQKFDQKRSNVFTDNLLIKQNLNNIDFAWSRRDYNEVIKSIDKIGFNQIPKSYQLKYKIAKHSL